ncbi:hypothetical protein DFH09DRAFT_851025, partial [Mycena vulgaris]
VCVIGDLNGRTETRRASRTDHPPRFSMDDKVNAQGRAILQLAGDHDLRILNGDLRFGNGSWGWTFSQMRAGKPCRSGIDYALCDMPACAMVQDFEVGTVNGWSDHAPLILKILVPHT